MGTLDKGIDILEIVQKNEDGISLKNLTKFANLNLGTAHRIASRLVKRGYLYQQQRRGKYFLGLRLMQFNETANFASTIKEIVTPYLIKLSSEVSEISAVTVLNRLEGIDIAINFHPQSLVVNMNVFGRSPLHCTSVGKILLAHMRKDEVELVFKQGLHAYTKNTIVEPDKLRIEIEKIFKEDVAFDNEEYAIDIRSVGAPLRMEGGKVIAAVCIVAPAYRLSKQQMKELTPLMQIYAKQISHALGYRKKK